MHLLPLCHLVREGLMGRLKPYVAYEASAGSGKTFTLSVRYVSLLFYDIRPEKILALTFTKKAANEMKQRILEVLTHLKDKPDELAAISEAAGLGEGEVLSRQPIILARFLRSEHKIMTIDSFLHLIVKNFSLYAGLAPDFTVGQVHDTLMQRAFLKRVRDEGLWDDLVWLALHENKKMQDIFSLFAFLYTKDKELPQSATTPPEGSGFALAEAVMQAYEPIRRHVLGCEAASDRLKGMVQNNTPEELAARSWIGNESLNYKGSLFNKCHIPALDEALCETQTLLRRYFQTREAEILDRLFRLYGCYKSSLRSIKSQRGVLGFEDVTQIASEILQGMDADFLYFRLDGRVEHLLIDEFQDTSMSQYEILRPMIEEIRAGYGTSDALKSFFYVGDVKQSIYRFRGGNASLFGHVLERHHIELEHLTTNWRSSLAVVNFVNATFMEKLPGYLPQQSKKDARAGYVAVKIADEIIPQMLETIQSLKASGVGYESMAILVFTNDDVVTMKEAILQAFGEVPVVTDSSKRLTSHKEVRCVIEAVKYLYFGEPIYLENFRALSGEKKALDRERYRRLLGRPFMETVHRLIRDFGLFKGDANLLRFIEVCGSFADAEAFIYGVELLDTPMLSGSHEGLRILTVHKSKGLEFEHVIVMDRLGRPRGGGDTLIFDYEGIALKSIRYRMKGRESVDSPYAQVKESEQRMADQDALNTLYVAFTRARESLVVMQKASQSAFERLGLVAMEEGRVQPLAREPKKAPAEPLACTPRPYGRQKLDVAKAEEREDFDFAAVDMGLAFHYALEMLGSFQPGAVPDAMTAVANRFVLRPEQLARIDAMVRAVVGDTAFSRLLDGDIHRERPFIQNGQMGVIDLFVVSEKVVRVIDYKTGGEHAGYTDQVHRYMEALRPHYPDHTIEGYLCFVSESAVQIRAVESQTL